MLKVALCDDEATQRTSAGKLLQEYAALHPQLAVKLSVFSSGQELLDAAEENGGFDLYLLDVVMPDMTGIELGVRLRKLGFNGLIIYLTISPEFAVDSYEARAFYYLMKPTDQAQLYPVLDRAVKTLEKRKAACVKVKTRDGLRLLRMDVILYAELAGRAVCYHLSGGERVESVTVRGPFQEEAADLLADSRFFLCGASFVVNLFYVTAVEKGFLLLDSGDRVPLARNLAVQARQQWSSYWLNAPGREAGL